MRNKYILLQLTLLIAASSASAQLFIRSGANLVATSGSNIVLNNSSLSNTGTISTPGSFIVFTGFSSTPANISSTSSIASITVNNISGLMLNNNAAVTDSVNFISGILDLNGYNLDLGATGVLSGESSNSYITGTSGGYIQRTATLNAPSGQNPGNIGIEITSSSNLGSTIIRRGHQQQIGISTSGNSINRYYDVLPTNNGGLNASVKFYYLNHELAGLIENQLQLFSSATYGSGWNLKGFASLDTTDNYLIENSLDSLNRITLGNISTALPLQLLSFIGSSNNSSVVLKWITTNEQDISMFEVEKSSDGIKFEKLTSVPSLGNRAVSKNEYNATDLVPFVPIAFYRLKIIGNSGSYSYSPIIKIMSIANQDHSINVYPNPSNDFLNLVFNTSENEEAKIQVFNQKGQIVLTQDVMVKIGKNKLSINIAQLTSGSYFLQLSKMPYSNIKFIKNN